MTKLAFQNQRHISGVGQAFLFPGTGLGWVKLKLGMAWKGRHGKPNRPMGVLHCLVPLLRVLSEGFAPAMALAVIYGPVYLYTRYTTST